MSPRDMLDAAQKIDLAAGLAGLGEGPWTKRVPQDFDHNLLGPARKELKMKLECRAYHLKDRDAAIWLLNQIKTVQKNRRERDRNRIVTAEKKQAKEAADREARERNERREEERERAEAELIELQKKLAAAKVQEREENERERVQEGLERMRAEREVNELQKRLAAEKRKATSAINQAERVKEKNKILAGDSMGEKRVRLTRECTKTVQQEERCRPTVAQSRCYTDFRLACVEIAPSEVHGNGLFSTVPVEAGADVLVVLLPDCGTEQYKSQKHNDYVHVEHKDCDSAVLIDSGSTVEGNVDACREDVKASYIRAMNHASEERDVMVSLILKEATKPDWYFPAGGAKYDVWYACRVVAERAIEPGDELRFRYASVPKEWK